MIRLQARAAPQLIGHPLYGHVLAQDWGRHGRHMKMRTFTMVLFLSACRTGGNEDGVDAAPPDSGSVCFPCEGYWICGGDVTDASSATSSQIDLKPENDGCYLSGLPGRNLLAPDGTVTAGGTVVGKATGTGARVTVRYPDGGQWLFCAGGGGC
jgi:hypothetical protein